MSGELGAGAPALPILGETNQPRGGPDAPRSLYHKAGRYLSVCRYGAGRAPALARLRSKCTVSGLLQLLFYAAAHLCSIFAACGRLCDAPSDQAVRDALEALNPQPAELEERLNGSFAEQLPKALRRRRQRVAIDLMLIPYHGQPQRRTEEIYRSQAKSGTPHFHAYASCYGVHHRRRYTVALMRVEQGTSRVAVLKRLLHRARVAGVRAQRVLLDRGFYSVEVIRYLQAARYPFIMPVITRGRKASDPRGPSGTRVFFAYKRSGWARYTHPDQRRQANRHRADLYPLPQLARAAQSPWPPDAGLCLLGHPGQNHRLGLPDLPLSLWDRDQLSPAQPSAHQNHHPLTHSAPAVCRDRLAAAQCLDRAPLAPPGDTSPRCPQLNLNKLHFKTLLLWLAHLAEQTFGVNDRVLPRLL
jgi:hypothetical protein